jgi:hypothetical protein
MHTAGATQSDDDEHIVLQALVPQANGAQGSWPPGTQTPAPLQVEGCVRVADVQLAAWQMVPAT